MLNAFQERKGIISVLKEHGFHCSEELTHISELTKIGNKLQSGKSLTKKESALLDSAKLYDSSQAISVPGGTKFAEISFTEVYNRLNPTNFYENEIVKNFLGRMKISRPTCGYEFAKLFCFGLLNANIMGECIQKSKTYEKTDQFLKDSNEGVVSYEKYELDWDKHKCGNFRNCLDLEFFSHFKCVSYEGTKSYLYVDSTHNTVYDLNFKVNASTNAITFNATAFPIKILEELNGKIATYVNCLRNALLNVTEIELKTENKYVESLILPNDEDVKPIAPFFLITTFFDVYKKMLTTVVENDGSKSTASTSVTNFVGLTLKPKLKDGYYRPNGYVLHLLNNFENFMLYIEEFANSIPKLSNQMSVVARNHLSLTDLGLKSRAETLKDFHSKCKAIDELKLREVILSKFKEQCPELWNFYKTKMSNFSLLKRMHFNAQIIDETNTTADSLVLAGEGGDGKSTDVTMLEMWLNSKCPKFAGPLDYGVILKENLGDIQWWRHRLLTIPEVPECIYHNDDFKKISGGDTFVKPVKYQAPRVMTGRGTKIIMTTNARIVADDHSIRRRLIILYYKNAHSARAEFSDSDLKRIVENEYDAFMKLCWRFYCLSNSTKLNGGLINYCEEDFKEHPAYDSNKSEALLAIRAISCDEELKCYPKGILTGDFSDSDLTLNFENIACTFLVMDETASVANQDVINAINSYMASPRPNSYIVHSIADGFDLKARKMGNKYEYEVLTSANKKWYLFIQHLKATWNINKFGSTKKIGEKIVKVQKLRGCRLANMNASKNETEANVWAMY